MGESQNPGVARPLLFSPMEGRDARAQVWPNLRNQVLSLKGEVPTCFLLGRGEAQGPGYRPTSGKKFSPSQGAAGHPLERDRESLLTRRGGLCAKRGVERVLGPPSNPPQRSSADGRFSDRRDAVQAMFSEAKNGCTGYTLPGDPCGGGVTSSAAPRKARKGDRGSDEAANPGRVLFLVYLAPLRCTVVHRRVLLIPRSSSLCTSTSPG